MAALLRGKLTPSRLADRPDLAESLSDFLLLRHIPSLLDLPLFAEKRENEKWLDSMRACAFVYEAETGARHGFDVAWKEAVIEGQRATIETIAQRIIG